MAEPGFYKKDKATIAKIQTQADNLKDELKNLYHRWELLDVSY